MDALLPFALLLAVWSFPFSSSSSSSFPHHLVRLSSRRSNCKPVPTSMSLCHGVGYSEMRLPNLLGHDTMKEALQQAASWVPLLTKQCHRDTKKFLCSLFAPVCVSEVEEPIFPCRSLCENVRDGCTPVMAAFGFPWPEMLNCSRFPQGNELCIPPAGPEDRLPVLREAGNKHRVVGRFHTAYQPRNIVPSSQNDSAKKTPSFRELDAMFRGRRTGLCCLEISCNSGRSPASTWRLATLSPGSPDAVCAACLDKGQSEKEFLDNVCSQDFALKMIIKSLSGVEGDLQVVPESKGRTLYKQNGWSEEERKKPVMWLANGEACSCKELAGPGSVVLAMGHRVAGRLVILWVRKWRHGEKEMKKFSRAVRKLQC